MYYPIAWCHSRFGWGGGGVGGAQENRGRGVWETGEERVGSRISTRVGSGREIQKGKCSLFITAYHPVKNTNPAIQYFYFHLASNTILYARKRKFILRLKKGISYGEIGNLFKSFTSLVMNEIT